MLVEIEGEGSSSAGYTGQPQGVSPSVSVLKNLSWVHFYPLRNFWQRYSVILPYILFEYEVGAKPIVEKSIPFGSSRQG